MRPVWREKRPYVLFAQLKVGGARHETQIGAGGLVIADRIKGKED